MSPVIGVAREQNGHPSGLPNFDFAWLEGPLEAKLVRVEDATDWNDPARWPEGRLFGEAGEYRWRKRDGDRLHCVLLLEGELLPPPFASPVSLERAPGEEGEAGFVLWGDWVDPGAGPASTPGEGPSFYAPEVPRAQRYPVAGTPEKRERPRLLVRRYIAREREQGEFVRCVGVGLIRDEGAAAQRE